MLYTKPKNKKDIIAVIKNLRKEDEEEMFEELGVFWQNILLYECMNNDIYIIENSYHKAVGLFGIKPHNNYAEVCLLCTNQLQNDAISFLRQAKTYIDKWLIKYKRLENYVHVNNKSAINWLKWLGFTIENFNNKKMYFYKELK